MEGLNETQNCTYLCCGCHALACQHGLRNIPNGRSHSTTPTCTIRPSTSKAATATMNLGNISVWKVAAAESCTTSATSLELRLNFKGTRSNTRMVIVPAGNPFLPAGGSASVQGNLFTYMIGPQFTLSRGKFRPFAEVLVGGAHSNVYKNAINNLTFTGVSGAPSNNTFAAAAGLGLDLAVSRRFSIRPFEMDYLYTNFNGNLGLTKNQNSWRYLGGVVLTFGGKPPIPPSASCSATPTEIWSGAPVTATISTQNFNPKHTVTYSWTSSGGKAVGNWRDGKCRHHRSRPGELHCLGYGDRCQGKEEQYSQLFSTLHRKAAACSDGDLLGQPADDQAGRFVHTHGRRREPG